MALRRDEHYFISNMPEDVGRIFQCGIGRFKILRNVSEDVVVADKGKDWVEYYRNQTPDPSIYNFWSVGKLVGNPNNN